LIEKKSIGPKRGRNKPPRPVATNPINVQKCRTPWLDQKNHKEQHVEWLQSNRPGNSIHECKSTFSRAPKREV
jgi:hypothetical protein